MIKPWSNTGSRLLADYRIFTIRADEKISPLTGDKHEFFIIDCVNWVNVIAVTEESHLVMIEQYRHGSNTVELEIPGGMMDQTDSAPIDAGLRELREETGYQGNAAEVIGKVFPNPAIMSNTCFTVLVKNCELKHPTQFDHAEDLVTRLVPIAQIPELVATGKILHSLVIVALYHFELWSRRTAV